MPMLAQGLPFPIPELWIWGPPFSCIVSKVLDALDDFVNLPLLHVALHKHKLLALSRLQIYRMAIGWAGRMQWVTAANISERTSGCLLFITVWLPMYDALSPISLQHKHTEAQPYFRLLSLSKSRLRNTTSKVEQHTPNTDG